MARSLDIVAPRPVVDAILNELAGIEEVLGVRIQRDASIEPPGDLLVITITNRGLHPLMRLLDRHRVGVDQGTSVTSQQPVGILSPRHRDALTSGRNEAGWEEIQRILAQDGGATVNTVLLMGISGALAATGLGLGQLHLVIGAMVIAPGFEPLVRIALGVVAGGAAWRRGLADLAQSYAALLAGAAVATLLLRAIGNEPLRSDGGYLQVEALVGIWSSVGPTSLFVSLIASVAGAIVVATFRSVLTAGVMIALALIPSAALVAISALEGEWGLVAGAALRWAVEAVVVVLASIAVLAWKRRTVHRRATTL